ncbi:MAG TPA: chemotaxis protein CheD [Bacillota bacterium]|nr:chemotaxis protein CheD [Bacillota bacterium]
MIEPITSVRVGISDLNVVSAPNRIRTSGLGSCVGVVIYDLSKKVGGLAHIMLPDSNLTREKQFNPYKYADTAIPILLEKLEDLGGRKFAFKAKLAGGAQMFNFETGSKLMRIGSRNVQAVENILVDLKIPIVASDVGGNSGRTIEFNPDDGMLMIRTVNQSEKYI